MKKGDINYVFEKNPELANIGTKVQYYKYLKTIFPDSKVQDVVYRGVDNSGLESFSEKRGRIKNLMKDESFDETFGIYFTDDKKIASGYGSQIYAAILNVQNVYDSKSEERYMFQNINQKLLGRIKNKIKAKQGFVKGVYFDKSGKLVEPVDLEIYDAVNIPPNHQYKYNEVVAFEPSQIHILGSKKDLKGFEDYIKNNSQNQFSKNSLEKKLVFGILFLSFLSGLFFISSNITGNVIGNFGYKSSNVLGLILFLAGLLGLYIFGKTLNQ